MTSRSIFDEMTGQGGSTREAYRVLEDWLNAAPPQLLEHRRDEAELLFRKVGITFAVYGNAEAEERLIPFDIIPRIMSGREWAYLSRGLEQRARALNLFLKDIYGAREIIRAGIVPAELIFQNPHYRPQMNGLNVSGGIYVQVAGIDVVRVDDKDFYVLEDNLRTPSGVSYMLENREVMLRLFPDLMAMQRIRPIENYVDELLGTLKSVAPERSPSDPVVVLLTPGSYNSAYYEHSFLADRMGVELVEGRDLVVRDEVVYMRTTEGPKRVDVIYSRLDDDFLDPLVFRANSALGVPGTHRRLSRRQCHDRERARHRGRRRQGDLQLRSRDRAILHGRRADPQERSYVALSRARGDVLCRGQPAGARRQAGQWIGGLRHAGGAAFDRRDVRAFPSSDTRQPRELCGATDPRLVDLPGFYSERPCPPPR